ncbi:MAG: MaoC family dehydratase [Polyangia bacterium]
MAEPRTYRWGRLLSDFEVGRTYEHPWEVTIDGGAIALLQASFLDATPIYSSAAYARELGFRDRPLSPLLCLNLGLSFSVHDVSEQAIAHLAYVEVRYPDAGYPGDTVRARSTVLGVKPASSGDRGVVHVRTVLENEHGHVLCAFERKALVRAGSLTDRPPDTEVTYRPTLATLATVATSSLEHLPPPLRQSRAYTPRSTLPGLAEDFAVGQVFAHDSGKTVGESEHMQLTLLLRNSHPLHVDELYCKANSFQKTRVVYGGLVLAWTLALTSRDLTGQALWDLGLVNGAHPNPTLGGDTLYALSRVESVKLYGATADVTLRIVGIKNQTGREAWAAHGDALFAAELDKPADQKLKQKVVEVTRTILVPRAMK